MPPWAASPSTVGCDRVLGSGEHGSRKEAGHEQGVPQHSQGMGRVHHSNCAAVAADDGCHT
jgi:hypothetical protein